MSIVTIKIGGRSFNLSCDEDSRARISTLAEKLDLEIDARKQASPSASFELSLIITALNLMDEKLSKEEKSGGQALENANADFHKQLFSIHEELKKLAQKAEKC